MKWVAAQIFLRFQEKSLESERNFREIYPKSRIKIRPQSQYHMTTTFTHSGGARIGIFNATWPFASLSGTPEAIRLSFLGRSYNFPKSNIRRLRRHRGIFSLGLRIEHTDPSFPEFVVFWPSLFFWSSGFQKLKAELEGLGYEIGD
jgi:hypothetical protein